MDKIRYEDLILFLAKQHPTEYSDGRGLARYLEISEIKQKMYDEQSMIYSVELLYNKLNSGEIKLADLPRAALFETITHLTTIENAPGKTISLSFY